MKADAPATTPDMVTDRSRRLKARSVPGRRALRDPLERHGRLLLRAYPAWYRRKRSEVILGTLLEASLPGRRWPSFRDARAPVIGGLRVRGALVWCLSILWTGLGAAGAGYNFILSTHVPEAAWVGIQPWAW